MIWPFRRFKGMIRPNMALGWDDSYRISKRKSIFMVEYLRARRDDKLRGIGMYRRWHLDSAKKLRP